MDEEQAVLDFFEQPENLPLALSVGELVDGIRQRMNNEFWRALGSHLSSIAAHWQLELTEDRNVPDCLVGLYLQPVQQQPLFLRPMLEQQTMGGVPRIYFGLMWSNPPAPDQLALPEIAALRDALVLNGFKTNDSFLAWQWSRHYPRSKSFLLRLDQQKEALLEEAAGLLHIFLITHGQALENANLALRTAPRSIAISLDSLRSKQR